MQLLKLSFKKLKFLLVANVYIDYENDILFSAVSPLVPATEKLWKLLNKKSRNTSPRFEVSVEYSLNLKENDSGLKFRIPKKVTTSWFAKSIF